MPRLGHAGGGLPEHLRLQLAGELHQTVKDLPPRLRARARLRGMVLTGGGALLPSLPGRPTSQIGLTVGLPRKADRRDNRQRVRSAPLVDDAR